MKRTVDRVHWLIERGSPAEWYYDSVLHHYGRVDQWSTDAHTAMVFNTKTDAEEFIKYCHIEGTPTEHVFIGCFLSNIELIVELEKELAAEKEKNGGSYC